MREEYKLLAGKKKLDEREIILRYTRIPNGYYGNVAELITTLNPEIQDSESSNPEWPETLNEKRSQFTQEIYSY